MTKRVWVTPREGLDIPDPETGELLRPAGQEKEQSSFWIRRKRDGDVTISDTKPAKGGGK